MCHVSLALAGFFSARKEEGDISAIVLREFFNCVRKVRLHSLCL